MTQFTLHHHALCIMILALLYRKIYLYWIWTTWISFNGFIMIICIET